MPTWKIFDKAFRHMDLTDRMMDALGVADRLKSIREAAKGAFKDNRIGLTVQLCSFVTSRLDALYDYVNAYGRLLSMFFCGGLTRFSFPLGHSVH